MKSILLIAFGVSCGLASMAAQDATPRFDVASVKPVEISPGPITVRVQFQPGGRFVATNATAMILLTFAFREADQPLIRPNEVLNAPAWTNAQHFNIEARAPADIAGQRLSTTSPVAVALVRSLLEDRFKMRAHAEMREMAVFALTLARKDGALGPNMRPSTVDCAAIVRERAGAAGRDSPPPMPAMPAPGQIPQCGMAMRPGEILAGGTTPAALPSLLAPTLPGATIVDHTGLAGAYDIDLRYAPETAVRAAPGAAAATLPDAPSIFTAVEEQLGLKLEPTHELRRVIVVDRIEQPVAD